MHYFTKITGIRETDQGTDLIVNIPGEKLGRKISKYKIEGNIDAELKLNDGRTITIDQRKKIYATIRDISYFLGDEPEFLKEHLKYDYCATTGEDHFSLSNCSISTAREFINHIIDFILKWDIPLTEIALNRTDDIDRYLYVSILYKKCALCGKPGEIHHALDDRIGMGNDRRKVNHVGRKAVCLCRIHHTMLHSMSEKEFYDKYKIYPIKLTEDLVKILKL